MHVHVEVARQIADIAGGGHVDLVFDTAGLRAIAHAQIAVALLGGERHKQQIGALVYQMPGELREFRVVADQHADGPAVGVDRPHGAAAGDLPPVALARGGVNLGLFVHRAIAQTYPRDIEQAAIGLLDRMRAADDVDVVAQRQTLQQIAHRISVLSQLANRFQRRQGGVLD